MGCSLGLAGKDVKLLSIWLSRKLERGEGGPVYTELDTRAIEAAEATPNEPQYQRLPAG